MPKSSIEMRTPIAFSSRRAYEMVAPVAMTVALGDLQLERTGAEPRRASARLTCSTISGCGELARGEVHGDGQVGMPPSCHLFWAQAVRSVHTPMGRMRLVISARCMKSPVIDRGPSPDGSQR